LRVTTSGRAIGSTFHQEGSKLSERKSRKHDLKIGHLPDGRVKDFLSHPEHMDGFLKAGVVFGVDYRDSSNESLFFGRDTLQRIIATGNAKRVLVVRVAIDFESDDLEALAAVCLVAKGSHCYVDADEPSVINAGLN
jgi:hypothetical protein